MTTTANTIDLQRFCLADLTDGSRYPAMAKPFMRGGMKYATDGRILIAVPAPGEPDTTERTPRAEELLPEIGPSAEYLPWPTTEPCLPCGQTGQVTRTCRVCSGLGEHWCDQCETDHECKACDEDCKQIEICDCREFGQAIEINCRTIARHYVYLASTLPNVQFFADRGSQEKPLRFRFNGGEGVVMPMFDKEKK